MWSFFFILVLVRLLLINMMSSSKSSNHNASTSSLPERAGTVDDGLAGEDERSKGMKVRRRDAII
jgi:hypothetical protein